MFKIEIVYKDSNGNIVSKEDIQKNKVRVHSINPKLTDSNGFQYKTRKSKNSIVKVYKTEPQQTRMKFTFQENDSIIKIENDKFFLSYNKEKSTGELYQKIDPVLVKNFLKDQKRIIKQIQIEIEKINQAKEDEQVFLNLVQQV